MSFGNSSSQMFVAAKLANTVDSVKPEVFWQSEATYADAMDERVQPLSRDSFLQFDVCRPNRSVPTHMLGGAGGVGQLVTLAAHIQICTQE